MGEMWGDEGEMWGDVGRCGEIWGACMTLRQVSMAVVASELRIAETRAASSALWETRARTRTHTAHTRGQSRRCLERVGEGRRRAGVVGCTWETPADSTCICR